uniref:Rho-GAP domain-containing protein n=1 Tax=Panagrellus redivivus TaxID=6233 RepID=A0A7E4WD79_PANRE
MPRRRSMSATRTVASTVNFVGRIGASLRLSGKNAVKRFDSTDNTQTAPSTPAPSSSWRARLDRSKSAVCQRTHPNDSFDSTDSVLLAAGTAIETGIGLDHDAHCTAGELVEYQPSQHALLPASPRGFYATAINSAPSSCPSTPQMVRRRYMKEGATQLTSLSTFITHHRYLFLFNDLLLVSKQKGANSYKLKQKVSLDKLWLSSNNSAHSFLIGWPLCNYVAHFNSEDEKNEWYDKLSDCVRRRFKAKSTTVAVAVKIEGRQQNIRKEVLAGQSASDLLAELIRELDLAIPDPKALSSPYELVFETGTAGPLAVSTQLHGIENVYAILMDHVAQSGAKLSESQMAHLDTCPLVHCRLVLRTASTTRPNTAMTLVNQVLKALSRSETKRLFGKELEGSMPPQPVLTMIDHLMIHGVDVEGIMRKSPKQATVRLLKQQLDAGQVPDFHQYNVHVTASLLKEYLRSIPGQLLLSGNYHLWMEVCESETHDRKLRLCKKLLKFLPQCHTVLLKSILRLLRRIASHEETSKMSIGSLAVCIAPSLLENPNIVDSARRVPDLAIFLIQNAPELFEGFDEDNNGALLSQRDAPSGSNAPLRLHQSTDSGLSNDDMGDLTARPSISPDSALFDSPISEGSMDEDHHVHRGPRIEEVETPESKEHTPVLSRENSEVYNFPHRYQWRSHLSADPAPGHRLTRQEAFRQVVSTQSSISSQDAEEPSRGLDDEIRVVRLPPGPMDVVPNVDQLRVSDIIISHRKKESTDSTKTLTGRDTGYSSKLSDYSTSKFSTISSSEGLGSSLSSSSSSSSACGYTRPGGNSAVKTTTVPVVLSPKSKRPLLTKSDTLGVRSPSPTTPTSASAKPLHRTRRLEAHSSLDRPPPAASTAPASPRIVHRAPLTRHLGTQGSLDRNVKHVPYRPPPRTAEEIVLDSSLEVNWSVSHIRTLFQNEDTKPAKIDTVYATLDSLKKQPVIGGN